MLSRQVVGTEHTSILTNVVGMQAAEVLAGSLRRAESQGWQLHQ